MTQTAANVAAGSPLATGGILAAPEGTALPVDESTTLDVAFKALGYAGEGGLEPSGEGATSTDLRAWGGDVVATVTEQKSITRFRFTLLEVFNGEVAKFVFGDSNVTVTPAALGVGTKIAIEDKGDEIPTKALVFDMKYEGKRMRIVVPRGKVTVTSELAYTDTGLSGYECEVTCLADDAGVRSYRYLANDDAL